MLIHSDTHPYANLQKQLLLGEQLKLVGITYPDTAVPNPPCTRIPKVYVCPYPDQPGLDLADTTWTLSARGTGKTNSTQMWGWLQQDENLLSQCKQAFAEWMVGSNESLRGIAMDDLICTLWGKVKLPHDSDYLRSVVNEENCKADRRVQRFFRVRAGRMSVPFICDVNY